MVRYEKYIEGHGRESLSEDIDITRTIGWFTSIYPVNLKISKHFKLDEIIEMTKKVLREVPNKGLDYGIMRYLNKNENNSQFLTPEIVFNFLGQFQELENDKLFQVVNNISIGDSVSNNSERLYPLSFNGIIYNDKLKISLQYNTNEFRHVDILNLIEIFNTSLIKLIDYCYSSISNTSQVDISTEIDSILEELN